jgi:hypothetical protein
MAEWDGLPLFPDSGGSPQLLSNPDDRRRQTLAKFEELQKLVNLRQLVQSQRNLLDTTRDIAFTLWCSYDASVTPNWIVQLHNYQQFLYQYDGFLCNEINQVTEFLSVGL